MRPDLQLFHNDQWPRDARSGKLHHDEWYYRLHRGGLCQPVSLQYTIHRHHQDLQVHDNRNHHQKLLSDIHNRIRYRYQPLL